MHHQHMHSSHFSELGQEKESVLSRGSTQGFTTRLMANLYRKLRFLPWSWREDFSSCHILQLFTRNFSRLIFHQDAVWLLRYADSKNIWKLFLVPTLSALDTNFFCLPFVGIYVSVNKKLLETEMNGERRKRDTRLGWAWLEALMPSFSTLLGEGFKYFMRLFIIWR